MEKGELNFEELKQKYGSTIIACPTLDYFATESERTKRMRAFWKKVGALEDNLVRAMITFEQCLGIYSVGYSSLQLREAAINKMRKMGPTFEQWKEVLFVARARRDGYYHQLWPDREVMEIVLVEMSKLAGSFEQWELIEKHVHTYVRYRSDLAEKALAKISALKEKGD